MVKTIVVVKGTFNDIYYWGKGFRDSETSIRWNKALSEVNSFLWTRFSDGKSNYLVSVQGSIFLHPMDFRAVLYSCGCHTDDTFDCGELLKICNEIAEKCGGTFELEVSKPTVVNVDLMPYEKGIHNTVSC